MNGVTRGRPVGKEGTFSVRTVHLSLSRARPAGGVNVWPVSVTRSVFLGDFTQVIVRWGEQDLVVRHIGAPTMAAGDTAYLHAPEAQCVLLETA